MLPLRRRRLLGIPGGARARGCVRTSARALAFGLGPLFFLDPGPLFFLDPARKAAGTPSIRPRTRSLLVSIDQRATNPKKGKTGGQRTQELEYLQHVSWQ